MSAPPVLVTGGAGYVGSHICKVLKQEGFLPICYDNLSRGCKKLVLYGPLVQADLAHRNLLKETLKKWKPIALLHLAAYAYVRESLLYPDLYYQNNVLGTKILLEEISDIPLKAIVFASSCATYGHHTKKISEETKQEPINPYGKTKLECEQMLLSYSEKTETPLAILRFFNVAGADLEGEIGESHNPETHILPLMIHAIAQKIPLEIFGEHNKRDFLHVVDLAKGFLLAFKYLLQTEKNLILNFGSEKATSLLELCQVVERHMGQKLKMKKESPISCDPTTLVASCSKAQSLLDWKPSLSDLDTIVHTAFCWYQKNGI